MKEQNNNIMNQPSMKLFTMLSGYFLLVIVLYTLCQFVRFKNCLGLIQILSITIPLIVYLLTIKNRKRLKINLIVIGIYLFLLVLLPFASGKTYDLTVDGNSYHKTAIAFIKNGWNPLYETSTNFQKNNKQVVKFDKKTRINLWIEHYPKATWIIAATMYDMTGNIESGKCMTIILSIMLLIISYNCLQTILSRRWAKVFALLITLNPITLCQLFSYYVDGLMGICFAIELFLLFLIKPMQKQNKCIWLSLVAICSIFVNLKFTGLLCSGVLAAVFYFYWLFKYRKEKDFFINYRNITVNFVVVFVTAIFLVGSNSYIKNLVEHKNPLYPLIGKDKVDIITTMQPKSFGKKSMPEKFAWSLFSKTENTTYDMGAPELKLPFKVYRSEVGELFAPDVRIGGFGPLFALSIILSLIVFIVALIVFIKNEKKNIKYITLPLIAITISMLLLGENWWARYVPQFYLFPVGTALLILYVSKYFKKELYPKLASITIITVLIANLCAFFYIDYMELKSFQDINRDLTEMYNTKNLKLKLGNESLYGYYYNLNDKGINYEVVKEIKEEQRRYKYSWRVEVEVNEEVSKTN